MIIDTTFRTKQNKEDIDKLVGPPYSTMKAIKMLGVGSARMIIEEMSHDIAPYLDTTSGLSFGSIEIRPGGVLVMFSNSQKSFTWAVPFYRFYLYKTSGLSIHANGKFIRFRDDKLLKENEAFVKKMRAAKLQYDQNFPSVEDVFDLK